MFHLFINLKNLKYNCINFALKYFYLYINNFYAKVLWEIRLLQEKKIIQSGIMI